MHNHPDKFIQKSDATAQTEYTTIRPKPFPRNVSNRMRTPLEKKDLVQYWPSDDNDSTDEELQKDPLEALINQYSQYRPVITSHFKVNPDCYNTTSAVWTGLLNIAI